jgi:hypothetical protein
MVWEWKAHGLEWRGASTLLTASVVVLPALIALVMCALQVTVARMAVREGAIIERDRWGRTQMVESEDLVCIATLKASSGDQRWSQWIDGPFYFLDRKGHQLAQTRVRYWDRAQLDAVARAVGLPLVLELETRPRNDDDARRIGRCRHAGGAALVGIVASVLTFLASGHTAWLAAIGALVVAIVWLRRSVQQTYATYEWDLDRLTRWPYDLRLDHWTRWDSAPGASS